MSQNFDISGMLNGQAATLVVAADGGIGAPDDAGLPVLVKRRDRRPRVDRVGAVGVMRFSSGWRSRFPGVLPDLQSCCDDLRLMVCCRWYPVADP